MALRKSINDLFLCTLFAVGVIDIYYQSSLFSNIDFQNIHFARQRGGDYPVVYLRQITQRNEYSENFFLIADIPLD